MIKILDFGRVKGRRVTLYTMENDYLRVGISDFGAIIQFIKVKTPNGFVDVTVGTKDCSDYVKFYEHFGGTIGRVANRVGGAEFSLDGNLYHLDKNNGKNNLHSGFNCYDRRFFNTKVSEDKLTMTLVSPDLDQGYPGRLDFSVEYELAGDSIDIKYYGKSDAKTPFAPTNHTYFNLDGEGSGPIYQNMLKIYADEYTPVDCELIPTGDRATVMGTALDFSEFKPIGCDIFTDCPTLKFANGFDHNFVGKSSHLATAYSIKTGIILDVYSDMPGIQFYSGNFMVEFDGKSHYGQHYGFCLEPQFFPNALNFKDFTSPVIEPGEVATRYITYKFSFNKGLKQKAAENV